MLGFVNSLIEVAWNLGTSYDTIGLGLLAGMITVGTLIVPIFHVSLLLRCGSNQYPYDKNQLFSQHWNGLKRDNSPKLYCLQFY